MRARGKVDSNHKAIREALESAGASVQSMANLGRGCPDLLVGLRGQNFVLEVKDGSIPPSKRKLTEHEANWIHTWRGQVDVVYNAQDALACVGLLSGVSYQSFVDFDSAGPKE